MTDNMADLATLKLRREALSSQRASGVARVSYDARRWTIVLSPKSIVPSRHLTARLQRPRGGNSSAKFA